MSEKKDESGGAAGGFGFGRLNQFGASLRQSAQEIGAKAAAQVSEINTKLSTQLQTDEEGQDASSVVSSPTASVSSSIPNLASLTPDSVDKKELVEIMQKMNKKLKVLTTIRQQLIEKVGKIEKEKSDLRTLVVDEILNGGVTIEKGQDEVLQLRSAWRQVDEQNSMALQQLQIEFKKLHAEQQSIGKSSENGSSNNALASWDAEKQELIQKYEQEIIRVKEELNTKMEELNTAISFTQSSASGTNHAEEIQKIKKAATDQLQVFKQKVATARNAEITKLKAEMNEQATKMVETKSEELRQQYQQEMESMKKQLSEQTSNAQPADNSEALQALQQQQSVELAKIRSELEESKASDLEKMRHDIEQKAVLETQTKLESVVNEVNQKNAEETERCRIAYEEKISQLSKDTEAKVQSVSDGTEEKIVVIQNELLNSKQTYETTIKSLQDQIETYRQTGESGTQRRLEVESELAKVRDESSASNGEKDKLQQQFAQEKETIKSDFQKRYQAAIQKLQSDANAQKDDAVNKVREEAAAKVEELKKEMEIEKANALQQVVSESEVSKSKAIMEANAMAASNAEKLQSDWEDKLISLALQLEKQTAEYELNSKKVNELQGELNEAKSVLDSARSGQEDSTKAMEEALAQQRASFDDRMKQEGDEYRQKIQLLSAQLTSAAESREEASSSIATLETNLRNLSEQNKLSLEEYNRKISEIKVELDERDKSLAEQSDNYMRQLEENIQKYTALESEHAQIDKQSRDNLQTLSEFQGEVEKMKLQHEEHAKQKEEELSTLRRSHEEAIAEIKRKLEEKTSELASVISSQGQANGASQMLQEQLNNLQAKYEADMVGRDKKFEQEEANYLQKIEELRQKCDSLQSTQSEKDDILQKNSQTLLQYNEELLADKEKEKEEEISKLSKSHEEALLESSRRLEEKTSELLNIASSGSDANEAVTMLQAQLSGLQAKYSADLTDRDTNAAQQTQQINELSQQCVSLQSEMSQKDENFQKNSLLLTEYNEQIENMKQQLAQLENQKTEELSTLKMSHESAISEINRRLEEKTSQLLNLSSSGEQSNEVLGSLQAELKALQDKYDADTAWLQEELKALSSEHATYQKEASDLRDSIKNSASSKEVELNEARQVVLTEKTAEMEALKASYEEKLQESTKKEAVVAQTFNKVKAAYAQKMKSIGNELNEKIASLEAANALLQKDVDTAKENSDSVAQKHEKYVKDLRASMEKKMEELVAEKETELKRQGENLNVTETERKNHEAAVSELQEKLTALNEEIDKLKASTNETVKNEVDSKLKVIEQERASAMENLESKYKDELKKLTEQNAILQPKAEFAEILETQKVELTNKLESQSRKNEEDAAKLRKTMETHVDKMTAQFKERLESTKKASEAEINAMQKLHSEKEQKLTTLVNRLKSLTATSTKLRDENDSLKKKIEAEVANQNELRANLDAIRKQFDESNSNSSATASSLLQEQEKLQHEKSQLANQLKSLQSAMQAKTNKIEELSGKLSALTSNLNALTEERKEQDEKLERALKMEPKLKASEGEVADLRDQINKLKLERQKNITMVERLQAEKEANERNHGSRTALVGMLEAQLSQVNDSMAETNAKFEAALYDLNQKQETIQSQEERIRKLETDLEDAQATAKKVSDALASSSKNAESKASKMVESLQKELQSTKQQMVRKSTAAQQLIQQREAESAELRATNRKLQQEVDKGSYSDRRIFELAAKQSNRETLSISEIEARDNIIERLKQALIERDGALANAEKDALEVESKIEDLSRVKRREDINIDYLKSIVVKYLSLPPGSDERARLLPVLATLLQFDECDYKVIEEGKNKVSWWGSSVIPTLINAPSLGVSIPASSGSAEVSVSDTQRTQGSGVPARTTSLQF